MELFVKATLYNREEKGKPIHYIRENSKFNVNCFVCGYATGTVNGEGAFGTFNLCLQGKTKDVNDYIAYLQAKGFKVSDSHSSK